jgi:hypothetical protein
VWVVHEASERGLDGCWLLVVRSKVVPEDQQTGGAGKITATNIHEGVVVGDEDEWTDGGDAVGLPLSLLLCRARGSWCCMMWVAGEPRTGVVVRTS